MSFMVYNHSLNGILILYTTIVLQCHGYKGLRYQAKYHSEMQSVRKMPSIVNRIVINKML